MMSLPVWLPGPMFLRGSVSGRGSLSGGGSLSRVGLNRETPRIRKVGGTHPTGMLSCYCFFCKISHYN